ncbi:MAG: RNA polymerase sigma factor [SAR202 cluster bacterium]|nr:RNA polymerase sigma factor [SAR202 cluster bacterium]
MQEQEAISRLKQGDIGGLEELVRRHQNEAVRAAYLIVRDLATAEDVVSHAFLKVRDKIVQFDDSRPFRPWFMRIVVNDAVKAATRSSREVSMDRELAMAESALASVASDGLGPEDEAVREESRRAIWAALGEMPAEQRAAVVMKYYLELKETEIAARMERPQGTVKWLLHQARKRLRPALAPLRGDGD